MWLTQASPAVECGERRESEKAGSREESEQVGVGFEAFGQFLQ